jgi:N-acetylmuramoyl-L-alanine amidase
VRGFFLLLIFFSLPSILWAKVILIDPGHGGEETGAIAKLSKDRIVFEKDLSLRLAIKIKKYLENQATVYLTRSLDRTVGLQERADMADKVKADLFVSVHFNSSTDRSAHGFETFYLDNNKDAAVKKVEKQENMTLKGEDLVVQQILIDLTIQQTVVASRSLSQSVHKRLKGYLKPLGMSDRGVKPGLFYVLALSKRPGLLLEAGFMSNDKELKVIHQEEFMERYAQGVALGIMDFLKTN